MSVQPFQSQHGPSSAGTSSPRAGTAELPRGPSVRPPFLDAPSRLPWWTVSRRQEFKSGWVPASPPLCPFKQPGTKMRRRELEQPSWAVRVAERLTEGFWVPRALESHGVCD